VKNVELINDMMSVIFNPSRSVMQYY